MKRALALLVPVLIVAATAGCDEQTLLNSAKAALAARGNFGQMSGDIIQSQLRLQSRLQDGTCTGDMNQYQYGGSNGQGGGNGGNGGNGGGSGGGDQDQIRLRLHDGSCTDPNSF